MPRNRRTPTLYFVLALLLGLCSLHPVGTLPAQAARQPSEPQIGAKAAVVVEYPSGKILYSKDMHARLAPASTTKIMTALLALEKGKLDEVVTVAQSDLVRGSSMGLKTGERQTLRNLLYGLMLPSGNDAANTIARHIATKSAGPQEDSKAAVRTFVAMMNAQVARYNLKDTNFANPHGLDRPNHYSSAYDLASLTWYAFQYPLFNTIVRQGAYPAPGHDLKNINKMIGQYPGADGVKTGYTRRAGLCLVSSATRNGKRLIAVVLNAPRWVDDSTALLDYGFARLAADPKATGLERLPVGKQRSQLPAAGGDGPVASVDDGRRIDDRGDAETRSVLRYQGPRGLFARDPGSGNGRYAGRFHTFLISASPSPGGDPMPPRFVASILGRCYPQQESF